MVKLDKRKIVVILLAVVLVILMGLQFYLDYEGKEVDTYTSDEIKFKEEYEGLNQTKNANDVEYLTLDIEEDNDVIYKNDEEIIDILENKTGVIYFGFSTCPWCRSMVETLIQSVKDNSVGNFYYVDISNIRSSYQIVDGDLVESKGSDSYYKLLEILDEYLDEYVLEENEKEYETGEKRLYAPTVVAVKEGEIVGFHSGTVDSQKDPYQGLSEEEQKELYDIFNDMIAQMKDGSCVDQTGC